MEENQEKTQQLKKLTQENENENYFINCSRRHIDDYIDKDEYRNAFGLLILVLKKLEEKDRTQLIKYYSKNLTKFQILAPKYI